MKRLAMLFVCMLLFASTGRQAVSANMAAPAEADIGSAVTFEKNDSISVLSEGLGITVSGPQAAITATYRMKNTADIEVFTEAMFLSPDIDFSSPRVTVNGRETDFEAESYALRYDTEIKTDDWRYVVLVSGGAAGEAEREVDSITFGMSFAPGEEYDVVVSYLYRLGGYPDYDYDAKEGLIEYYLMPAALWKDFKSLTVNLYLDEDMPVIKESSVEFEKTGERAYRFVSDTLPGTELEIVIDENWFQNILSTLRSPYLPMTLLMFLPFVLAAAAVIALLLWAGKKRKRSDGKPE